MMFSQIKTKKTKSHSTIILLISSLIAFTCIVSTSCKIQFFPDIKNYLKEYTETAAVNSYTTSLGSDLETYRKKDKDGNYCYCIPSDKDFVITFQLRNPQSYIFRFGDRSAFNSKTTDPSMTVFFDNLKTLDIIGDKLPPLTIIGEESKDTDCYVLLQQKDVLYKDGHESCYYLTLTYSQDFLYRAEMGHDISPTIRLRHPDTKVDFPTFVFKDFQLSDDKPSAKIVSNSVPPTIYSPIVYQDEENNKYVLLFNMPSQGLLKGIHRDIKKLTIKSTGDGKGIKAFEYNYDVNINYTENEEDSNNGTFTLTNQGSAKTLTQGDPTNKEGDSYNPKITPTGAVFDQKGQPVYVVLNDSLSDNEITYSFILTDDFGLQSKSEANIRSKRLSDIYVTDVDGYILSGGEEIKQDKNSSYATVNFIPALRTYWFVDDNNGIQNKYYIDEVQTINGTDETVSVAKNFIFDETKIDENNYTGNNLGLLKDSLPGDAYLKINENGTLNKIDAGNDTQEEIKSWTPKYENTSECSIVYEIYQGTDDKGISLYNSSFDCIESSGSHPVKTPVGEKTRLDTSGNTLKSSGHYLPIQLPAGEIFVRVYAHKPGFADTTPVEFMMEVLRTRLYVSNEGSDDVNNGSFNSPFATITHAAEMLSRPEDTSNTIYVATDLTDNIKIPAASATDNPSTSKNETKPLYVKIMPTEGTRTIKAGTATNEGTPLPLLSIPDNTTVILENLILQGGDIEVGDGAKLYLNNVTFTGKDENNNTSVNCKLHIAPTGIVILGGKTIIDSTTSVISLEEGAKVQLGNDTTTTPSKAYVPQELVLLQTVKTNPRLNIILLETENGSPIKQAYRTIYDDLTSETNSYNLFKLDDSKSPGYYIGYDDEKPGSSTYGRGLVKIPAAYISEPEVGGFTVNLYKTRYSGTTLAGKDAITAEDSASYGTNIYAIRKGSKITYTVTRNNIELTALNSVSNLKMELYLEGDLIEVSKTNAQLTAPEITIPTSYPAGYYTLYVYFTYDGITYCEHFTIYMEVD